MAEVKSTFSLRPGDAAPDFELPAPDGGRHGLRDLRGSAGLVLVFACNHCPFVVHLADALGGFADEMRAEGVATVAINSNDIERFPADGPERMADFAAEHGWNFPYLVDETQEVAKSYGAACTPDFFLFDHELRLFYAGQFDPSRPRGSESPTGADLRDAVKRMLAGGEPPLRPFTSSGCNIKWKPGNEPPWFA